MSKVLAIFDLDGTLVDTPSGIVQAFNSVLLANNFTTVSEKDIRHKIGLPLETAFAQLMNILIDDARIPELIVSYQHAFRELVIPLAPQLVFPEVIDGLTKLKAHGVILTVATSKVSKSANALLDAAGLSHFFHKVLGADNVKQPKPHPEMAQILMKDFQASTSQTCMVGDTTHDMLMAQQAGIAALGVDWGVHSLEQLQKLKPLKIATTFNQIVDSILRIKSNQEFNA